MRSEFKRACWPVVLLGCVLLAMVLWLTVPVEAQQAEPGAPGAVQDNGELADSTFAAPVVIDGETLFVVRGSSALPAEERAAKIELRILEIADLSERTNVSVTIVDAELGRDIFVDNRMVTTVTEADAEFEQFDLEVLTALQAEAIEAAIITYRKGRTSEARVDSVYAAFGWTAGFLLVTLIFSRMRRRIIAGMSKLSERHMAGLETATNSIVRSQAIATLIGFVTNAALWIGFIFLLYYYLSFVLLAFAETRPLAQLLLTYVTEPLVNIIWGFVAYIPNLIMIVIIIFVTRYVIRGMRLVMENVESGAFELRNFEDHWIRPTFNLARAAVIAIAVVFIYPYIPGSDSRAFQGLTILAGVMVSLGSNAVVSNMMAGLFVLYRRSTNVGDRIKVGDQIGDVVEIKLMETLIKSIKNETISIPNAELLNSEVVNYSRKIDGRGLLVHTTVGIGYEEPQDKIEAMLIEAARRTSGLKKSPEPFVLCVALADYAVNYQINAFTTRGSLLPKIRSDLHLNILAVFNENNVQIMTPSYMADPETPKIAATSWDGQLAQRSD